MVLRNTFPIINEEIVDFNAIKKFVHYIFYNDLKIDPSEHGLILIEHPLTSRSQREKICSFLFEDFNIPAILLVNAALADAMCVGKTTGLVIRLKNPTYIVPVWDSYPLTDFIKKIDLGIEDVTSYLQKILKKKSYDFRTSAEREILRDIREKLCFVALDPDKESSKKSYTLPDGTTLELDELFLAPEIYFKPKMTGKDKIKPLDVEIFDTLMKLDSTIREDLSKNIIVSGLKIKGMKARLQKELENLATFPIKITQAEQYSSWLGSSILGSLKEFEYPSKNWITLKEYYKHGATIIHYKAENLLSRKD